MWRRKITKTASANKGGHFYCNFLAFAIDRQHPCRQMQKPQGESHSAQPNKKEVPLSWDVFREHGITVSEWAKERGFNKDLVYAILRGKRKCLRGASYEIARELGLKK